MKIDNSKNKYGIYASDIRNLLNGCDYLILQSQRKVGKSYASKECVIEDCYNLKCEMMYVRRLKSEVKDIDVILFCVILIYFFVKLFISIGFIDDIKNIFDDFGTVSFKYSMVYYYFNTLRILLVAPTFTNEKIFDSMEADLIKETDNINKVLNNRMKNYASTNILFNAFTRSQEDTSITNISAIICKLYKLF